MVLTLNIIVAYIMCVIDLGDKKSKQTQNHNKKNNQKSSKKQTQNKKSRQKGNQGRLQKQTRGYWRRMALLHIDKVRQNAGEPLIEVWASYMGSTKEEVAKEIEKETNNLKAIKSKLLKQFDDAIDAMLLMNSSIRNSHTIFERMNKPDDNEPDVEFRRILGIPEKEPEFTNDKKGMEERLEYEKQIDDKKKMLYEMHIEYNTEFVKNMDRFIQDIFTPKRMEQFANGMFFTESNLYQYGNKDYRTVIAKILLQNSALHLIHQLPNEYNDLLANDLRRAIQIAGLQAKKFYREYGLDTIWNKYGL